jgi:hypothetical protein
MSMCGINIAIDEESIVVLAPAEGVPYVFNLKGELLKSLSAKDDATAWQTQDEGGIEMSGDKIIVGSLGVVNSSHVGSAIAKEVRRVGVPLSQRWHRAGKIREGGRPEGRRLWIHCRHRGRHSGRRHDGPVQTAKHGGAQRGLHGRGPVVPTGL